MVGFICVAASGAPAEDADLVVDMEELEDARWFEKPFVREQLAKERAAGRDGPEEEGGFHVPSQVSLARTLVEHWLQEV